MSDNLMIANSHPPEEWSGITFNTGPGRVVIRITSDGKLEKAEGYSDEEAAQVMFDAVSGHIDGIWKKVRDENAALRADKERLDWIETNARLTRKVGYLRWSFEGPECGTVRGSIDIARGKEAQP